MRQPAGVKFLAGSLHSLNLRFHGPCRTRNPEVVAIMTDFAAARRTMVDGQLRTFDITDQNVLAAVLAVPRERFVP